MSDFCRNYLSRYQLVAHNCGAPREYVNKSSMGFRWGCGFLPFFKAKKPPKSRENKVKKRRPRETFNYNQILVEATPLFTCIFVLCPVFFHSVNLFKLLANAKQQVHQSEVHYFSPILLGVNPFGK